ncbi:MAG: hypothetical protein ACLRFI_03285 [Alphaproteobacteria bacterium]
MKTEQVYTSRHHKILCVIALAGLFACGLMIGIIMSSKDCAVKYDERIEIAKENNVIADKNKKTESIKKQKLPQESCAAIEVLLKGRLHDETDNCMDLCNNLEVYSKLTEKGCPENVKEYNELYNRTLDIIKGISCENNDVCEWLFEKVGEDDETCQRIENELLREACPGCAGDADTHIDNAKIYAIIAERGCPEHREEYVEKVKNELEIARALEDDKFEEDDTIEVVETYKRINMQNAAQEFFDKAKKLTNPAIDFILEVEKIIEE